MPSRRTLEIINRYGNAANFLTLFNPDKQQRYCRDLRRVYMGSAPALSGVAKAFGENTAKAWLVCQLVDLSEFSGCKEKLTPQLAGKIADTIMSKWYYLKVSELMLFFLNFKAGEYGKFYNGIDGFGITEALGKFCKQRYDAICRYEVEEQAEREAEEREIAAAEAKACIAALKVCNMTISEFVSLELPPGLSCDELAEVGWLFRMGYESKEERERQAYERAKFRSNFGKLRNIIGK